MRKPTKKISYNQKINNLFFDLVSQGILSISDSDKITVKELIKLSLNNFKNKKEKMLLYAIGTASANSKEGIKNLQKECLKP